jgi:hypothetical protein
MGLTGCKVNSLAGLLKYYSSMKGKETTVIENCFVTKNQAIDHE